MIKSKTLIKICGITSLEQAVEIAELGVDAIGLISVKESPRYLSALKKKEIFKTLEHLFPKIKRVSVVKNIPISNLKNLIDYENVLQLHGDEDLQYCKDIKKEIPNLELWKAFRINTINDIEMIDSYLKYIDAALLDSWNKDVYGGTGIRIKEELLRNISLNKPWWLAGGISIDWIQQIIKDIRPNGLDISSSIEKSPGIKDIELTKELLREIKK